jgi:hypothetical protein
MRYSILLALSKNFVQKSCLIPTSISSTIENLVANIVDEVGALRSRIQQVIITAKSIIPGLENKKR